MTTTTHLATTTFPVHALIAGRWSPRAFTDASITPEDLGSLLEAARWAPSCYNEQPWRFIVARKEDEAAFARLAACLVDANGWAKQAAALVVTVAKATFTMTGEANAHAWHDVGLAAENLTLQAEALGLATHQMGGFDAEKARTTLGIPDDFTAVAMIAVGHPGPADSLPEALAERERAPRERKPLADLAFQGAWNERPAWLAD